MSLNYECCCMWLHDYSCIYTMHYYWTLFPIRHNYYLCFSKYSGHLTYTVCTIWCIGSNFVDDWNYMYIYIYTVPAIYTGQSGWLNFYPFSLFFSTRFCSFPMGSESFAWKYNRSFSKKNLTPPIFGPLFTHIYKNCLLAKLWFTVTCAFTSTLILST